MKCKDCSYKEFAKVNGGANRWYCTHEAARFVKSECEPTPMICRTKRHSEELTIKTAPKWCPINKRQKRGED